MCTDILYNISHMHTDGVMAMFTIKHTYNDSVTVNDYMHRLLFELDFGGN